MYPFPPPHLSPSPCGQYEINFELPDIQAHKRHHVVKLFIRKNIFIDGIIFERIYVIYRGNVQNSCQQEEQFLFCTQQL